VSSHAENLKLLNNLFNGGMIPGRDKQFFSYLQIVRAGLRTKSFPGHEKAAAPVTTVE
jgi:hypothetical protein